ncbi:MAG: permease [Candidatus Aenigmarchaeota archaeon]|nr:permease [Candidatus Aenigmarchaeota archaeon]
MENRNVFIILVVVFLALYFMPVGSQLFDGAILSAFSLLHEYATQHVITCLIPAMFIAGAISVFIKKDAVIKYMGPSAKKYVSYTIASVSGAILAVCSCTVLPLFASIRKRGAGLGPAIAFLYSGPAINITAMFLTISVLGVQIGIARIVASISLSILVGLTMAFIFKEKSGTGKWKLKKTKAKPDSKLFVSLLFVSLVGVLLVNGLQINLPVKYSMMAALSVAAALVGIFGMQRRSSEEWLGHTWFYARKLIPLLFIGVFIAGVVMFLVPDEFIRSVAGENTIMSNVAVSIFGAFMYFSTLTEIPILQALIAKGMHPGPALTLLLSGPALSLPSMLAIREFLGNRKTIAYVLLVILYSAAAGLVFGMLV